MNGKPQAMKGFNDDLVMALAIGVWVRNTSYVIRKFSKEFIKSKLSNVSSGLNNKYEQ